MKKRVLSAIVMLAVFIPLLIVGGKPYALLMCILAACGLYELLRVASSNNNFPTFMKACSYFTLLFICTRNVDSLDFNYTLNYKVIAIIIFLFLFSIVFYNDNNKYNITDALYLIGGVLFLGFSFNLLIIARNHDLYTILYLLIIATMTDTFAYITGMLVGRHKLVPKISPKKTIEGLLGGSIMGVVVGTAFYHVFINPEVSLLLVIGITTILSLIGQMGDLVFSTIKRHYDKKDFSNLIPGHGGILDRFDSIIFIALAFILVANFL